MSRACRIVFAALALVALTPGPARAGAGCTDLAVFFRVGVVVNGFPVAGTPGVDPALAECAGYGGDSRVVYPGSNIVNLRFARDLGPAEITGSVAGLGAGATFSMRRDPMTGFYDGPWVPIDPTATGTLTASAGGVTVVYRTVL